MKYLIIISLLCLLSTPVNAEELTFGNDEGRFHIDHKPGTKLVEKFSIFVKRHKSKKKLRFKVSVRANGDLRFLGFRYRYNF